VLLACAAGAGTAYAQDDVQLWINANTSGPVHGPYRVSAEVHARWMDDVQKYQRTVLRLQGGRALTPHVTAWFGFEETWPVAHRTVRETRIWQQVIFVQPVGTWSFSHRGCGTRSVPRVLFIRRVPGAPSSPPKSSFSCVRLISAVNGSPRDWIAIACRRASPVA
jgi:hypothetical protein